MSRSIASRHLRKDTDCGLRCWRNHNYLKIRAPKNLISLPPGPLAGAALKGVEPLSRTTLIMHPARHMWNNISIYAPPSAQIGSQLTSKWAKSTKGAPLAAPLTIVN
jgi:hypothetical protein